MTRPTINGALSAAYTIAAIITFGHSAASETKCKPHTQQTECEVCNAIAAAAAWPLYWSWTIQR